MRPVRPSPDLLRQVSATVLFADICGSTRLFEEYGDWQARQIESQILELLKVKTAEFDGNGHQDHRRRNHEPLSGCRSERSTPPAKCTPQSRIRRLLMEFNIAVKIGLQHGPLLVEHDDLFGDAVNVAARMVSLAKADQIITTRETALCLPEDLEQMTRSLGRSRVRGKQE
jgi:adenylate cyclase